MDTMELLKSGTFIFTEKKGDKTLSTMSGEWEEVNGKQLIFKSKDRDNMVVDYELSGSKLNLIYKGEKQTYVKK